MTILKENTTQCTNHFLFSFLCLTQGHFRMHEKISSLWLRLFQKGRSQWKCHLDMNVGCHWIHSSALPCSNANVGFCCFPPIILSYNAKLISLTLKTGRTFVSQKSVIWTSRESFAWTSVLAHGMFGDLWSWLFQWRNVQLSNCCSRISFPSKNRMMNQRTWTPSCPKVRWLLNKICSDCTQTASELCQGGTELSNDKFFIKGS